MVQRNYIAEIHFTTTLNEVEFHPHRPADTQRQFLSHASIQAPQPKIRDEVTVPKQLQANIGSFTMGQSPQAGDFVFCSGQFWCTTERGKVVVHIKAFNNYPLPLPIFPDDVARIPQLQELQVARVSLTGLVGADVVPATRDNLRAFTLQTTVWAQDRPAQFTVQCFYPKIRYFEKTRVPSPGELCSISGTVMSNEGETGVLKVLLAQIAFLPRASDGGSAMSNGNPYAAEPVTPPRNPPPPPATPPHHPAPGNGTTDNHAPATARAAAPPSPSQGGSSPPASVPRTPQRNPAPGNPPRHSTRSPLVLADRPRTPVRRTATASVKTEPVTPPRPKRERDNDSVGTEPLTPPGTFKRARS